MWKFLVGLVVGAVSAHVMASRPPFLADWPARLSEETKLDDLTKAELYKRAHAAEIPGRASMTKAELSSALSGQALG
jgi:hypothetical protein